MTKTFNPSWPALHLEVTSIMALILAHGIQQKDYSTKHIMARHFLDELLEKAARDTTVFELLHRWVHQGGTVLLRDELLPQIWTFNNDYMPHFNAMTLLDDVHIQYLEIKAKNSHSGDGVRNQPSDG